MMNNYVADTMALILRIEKRKMPQLAKDFFIKAESQEAKIYIPAIALAELSYLSAKGRITVTFQEAKAYINNFPNIEVKPLDLEIIESSFQITDIPELHDRLIAGTAKFMSLELITNDPVIRASGSLNTLWS